MKNDQLNIARLIADIQQTREFTDAQQADAISWVGGLGRRSPLDRMTSAFKSNKLDDQCMQLAHLAAEHDRPAVIEAIGKNPTGKGPGWLKAGDVQGNTPMHLAADHRSEASFIALVEAVDPREDLGRGWQYHAIHGPANNPHVTTIEYWSTQKNRHGQTPMDMAVENGFDKAFGVMANHHRNDVRALLTARDASGSNAAHKAAVRGNSKLIDQLLNGHPDVQASLTHLDGEGKTPADLARETGHLALVGRLKPANIANERGGMVEHYANLPTSSAHTPNKSYDTYQIPPQVFKVAATWRDMPTDVSAANNPGPASRAKTSVPGAEGAVR